MRLPLHGETKLACFAGASASLVFFFNDTATTEIYTLSLHDALPIFMRIFMPDMSQHLRCQRDDPHEDQKSTRLNSSHGSISYAVFCLKKREQPSACQSEPSRGEPIRKPQRITGIHDS